MRKQKNDFWTVIPAYNEARHISKVISEAGRFCSNIVVVDDGSKDNTYDVAYSHDVSLLKNVINLGKGAALKTGCDYAVENGAKVMVVIDSDGQHEPAEIPNFLKSIAKGNDIVFGYREFSGEMPLVFRFGNWFITFFTRILYGISLKDTQSGYRAFTSDAYKKIRWQSSGYSMESEMIANAGRHKLKYSEVKIRTIYAEKYKGTTILDGLKIVFNMLLWRLRR